MLWKHILVCKDNACKVMHCLSSRYVLSHYAKCDDCYCSICPRVRESAKRESTDSMDPPTSSAKKPRSSYWWASEKLVNFTKAITVTTRDFIHPHPQNAHPRPPPNSVHSSPQPTPMPSLGSSSVEKLNFNLTHLSIHAHNASYTNLPAFPSELPPRRPEPRSERPPEHTAHASHLANTPNTINSPYTAHTTYATNTPFTLSTRTETEPPSALDLLATAATTSSLMKPPTRPRASSGASTATAGSSYSDTGLPSISPSFHSSSSSSALFAHMQPAPYVSVAPGQGGPGSGPGHEARGLLSTGSFSLSTASAAQHEECQSNLSSFSSVCSYRESNNGSPYMTPQLSPVGSFKEESKFKF